MGGGGGWWGAARVGRVKVFPKGPRTQIVGL